MTVPLPLIPVLIVHVWMLGLALHVAIVPPLLPAHVQFQGPLPVTVEAVPVVQRFVVGATVKVLALLLPQVPLIAARAKVAVTLFEALMVTVQVVLTVLSQPLQLAKLLPLSGEAVRVTEVPEVMVAEQVGPQLMLLVDVVTVPVPVPDLVTERVKVADEPVWVLKTPPPVPA